MLWVPDGIFAVVGFRVRGRVGDSFSLKLEGAGFGAGERVEEAPFVDLVADLAGDSEDVGHGDWVLEEGWFNLGTGRKGLSLQLNVGN